VLTTPIVHVLDVHANSYWGSASNVAPIDSIVDVSSASLYVPGGASVAFEVFASFTYTNLDGRSLFEFAEPGLSHLDARSDGPPLGPTSSSERLRPELVGNAVARQWTDPEVLVPSRMPMFRAISRKGMPDACHGRDCRLVSRGTDFAMDGVTRRRPF
jgi:hypothetical protein